MKPNYVLTENVYLNLIQVAIWVHHRTNLQYIENIVLIGMQNTCVDCVIWSIKNV